MLESEFQSSLIRELKDIFPGCMILKNDPNYFQGIPDLTILWGKHWAVLECKKSINERFQPNQEYYIDWLNNMSYSSVIYPENKEEVLHELQQAFRSNR